MRRGLLIGVVVALILVVLFLSFTIEYFPAVDVIVEYPNGTLSDTAKVKLWISCIVPSPMGDTEAVTSVKEREEGSRGHYYFLPQFLFRLPRFTECSRIIGASEWLTGPVENGEIPLKRGSVSKVYKNQTKIILVIEECYENCGPQWTKLYERCIGDFCRYCNIDYESNRDCSEKIIREQIFVDCVDDDCCKKMALESGVWKQKSCLNDKWEWKFQNGTCTTVCDLTIPEKTLKV